MAGNSNFVKITFERLTYENILPLQRREQFRAVWGVSPKSINQKRDLKTVLNVQKVAFSSDLIENDNENVIQNDNGNENDLEQNDMFGMNTIAEEVKNDNENDEEKAPIGNYHKVVALLLR